MEFISLNKKKSYYLVTGYGVAVSSFEEDVLIENDCAVSLIKMISQNKYSYPMLVQEASSQFSAQNIMSCLTKLLSAKLIQIASDDDLKSYNLDNETDISFSYFDTLLSGHVKSVACYSENILLYFSESDTICIDCFRRRVLAHRPILNIVHSNKSRCISKAQGSISQSEITNLKESIKTSKKGLLYIFNLEKSEQELYQPASFFGCEKCQPDFTKADIFKKIESEKIYPEYGYRAVPLSKTIERLMTLVNPYAGIIPKVLPYKKLDSDLVHNYSSGRNLAFSGGDRFWLKNYLRSSNGGKGKSKEQAITGALAEAVERYSMVHQGQMYHYKGSLENSDIRCIRPDQCLLFSESQYKKGNGQDISGIAFHQLIPAAFNDKSEYCWHEVYSLTHREICLAPGQVVYARYQYESDAYPYAYPDSNGCSAGNSYSEAVIQGTLELIERDAAAIWWYNMLIRPRVNLSLLNNDYINKIVNYYTEQERAIYTIDITTDIGIPVFVSVSYNLSTGKEILYGFGAHIDYKTAIERSIIELNQLLPIVSTARSKTSDQKFYEWLDNESIDKHAYLFGVEDQQINAEKIYSDVLQNSEDNIVQYIVESLKLCGVELIACDLTPQDIKFPVVKMIAPGLRHFWRRTAPGRLYDVPVKLNWKKSRLLENELNPFSITI
ncbi:YcaO-like family protein [Oceanospirillum sediminis]|uniref:YcaO-like family protein n=1 Tax=Oceanospirillum sediminis TaxID=2760088 RepID=A0A839INW1_9GAMM|nr:YcaO-like family protein [Oceanospirillum sediminis]MBB1486374.1 YcaO-like family protein [Oceanospirillum sediminis]